MTKARTLADNFAADINGITAGVGITGGGTSGTVTITNDMATTIAAKGDLVAGTGNDTYAALTAGTNEQRLVADSSTATGLKYVADTTNYAIAAKGDLLAGTAADTVGVLTLGTNDHVLTADSAQATGLKWAAAPASNTNWTLVNSGGTALTGSGTITISSISGANKLLILVETGSSANAGSVFRVRFNSDSTTNYQYYGQQIEIAAAYAATSFQSLSSPSDSKFDFGIMSASANSTVSGYLLLDGGNASGVKAANWVSGSTYNASPSSYFYDAGGIWKGSSTISSVSLISSTGNFDGGTIFVYKSA